MASRVFVPGSNIKVCVVNTICLPGVTLVPSTELSTSLAVNVTKPGRPFLPWRTTVGGDQFMAFDFGSARTLTGIWLVRTNFTSVRIEGNTTNVWTSPAFSKTLTVTRSPWNFRYQINTALVGFSYRWMRVFIPSQTPLEGTTYLLGGIYAGVTENLPQNFRFDVEMSTLQPSMDSQQQYGAFRQRLVMGEPVAQVSATRAAKLTRLAPGYQDDLNRWQDLARRIRDNDFFAISLGTDDASQGFIVRPINQDHWKWTVNLQRASSPWLLEEVVGP